MVTVGLLVAGLVLAFVFAPDDVRSEAVSALLSAIGFMVAGARRKVPDDRPKPGAGNLIVWPPVLLALVVTGCGGSALTAHARAADVTGVVINETTAAAEQEYQERQLAEVEEACGSRDPSEVEHPCQQQARDALAELRAWWEPAWVAHEGLEEAHDRYVQTITLAAAGELDDPGRWAGLAARVVDAYQAFAAVLGQLDLSPPPLPEWVVTLARLAGGER